MNSNTLQTAQSGSLHPICSALDVAEMVAKARDLLADAVETIENRRTFSGGKWKEGMRTRGEGEGKYGLRNALVELRSKAEWLKHDATAPNGGWPNAGYPENTSG